MKRVLLIALALMTVVPAAIAAESPLRQLKGTCIWQSVSYETTSGATTNSGPSTQLASLTFDGHGGMEIGTYDVNINGTFSSSSSIQGSYTVDSNGHGSFTFTSPASGRTLVYDFFLTRKRDALKTMLQSDNNPPPLPRISSGECHFDE